MPLLNVSFICARTLPRVIYCLEGAIQCQGKSFVA